MRRCDLSAAPETDSSRKRQASLRCDRGASLRLLARIVLEIRRCQAADPYGSEDDCCVTISDDAQH